MQTEIIIIIIEIVIVNEMYTMWRGSYNVLLEHFVKSKSAILNHKVGTTSYYSVLCVGEGPPQLNSNFNYITYRTFIWYYVRFFVVARNEKFNAI